MSKSASDLFIVDNSDADWKVRSYLSDWCELSKSIDIATGYFEIGALLSLNEKWQQVDKIRILMGDEVSYKTKRAFEQGLRKIGNRLDQSLELEKLQNDFLEGVPAIVEAIRSGKIECRVYRKDKFHAKAYITHGRAAVVGSFGLVGSSNFTYPGLCDNVELNVQIRGPEVGILQDWYERNWEQSEDITPDILKTLQRHSDPRIPFEIWVKSLYEFFKGKALTPDIWEKEQSKIFQILDKYQQDAYKNLLEIAERFGMAFLCDGVGLGKTFVGLMIIERKIVHDKKNVVLFAPKAAREDVWERVKADYFPRLNSRFNNFVIFNHTDLQCGEKMLREIEETLKDADVVIIDEAHNFRNPGIKGEGEKAPSRYRKLQEFMQLGAKKQLYLLTATPINNSVHDFRHMLELRTNNDEKYFSQQLGIQSVRSHFVQLERKILSNASVKLKRQLDLMTDVDQIEDILRSDVMFDNLVVQRSRRYVKESQIQQGFKEALFPTREKPKVKPYNLKSVYGELLKSIEKAFDRKKPLFVLSIYYPLAYWKGNKESPEYKKWDENRQKQVVSLVRTLFLKRFESSSKAFESSCWLLLKKLFAWVKKHALDDHESRRLNRWKTKHAELINFVLQPNLFLETNEEDQFEDFINEDLLNSIEQLDPEQYDISAILDDTFEDLNQLAEFLTILKKIDIRKDDKLNKLIELLTCDPVMKKEKVIIFTEFADTANYIHQQLKNEGVEGIFKIDGSSSQRERSDIIRRFSPYYNGSSSAELNTENKEEIRVLISTDVLAEGLNLQDAMRLINYDIHWNPVRLMQRIGRIDRRMNPDVEKRLLADHPDKKKLRGNIEFWNFLPPNELDDLLRLFNRVNSKTLVISRTLGIEGKKLLTPDDDFDDVKELNEQCDGTLSDIEKLRLEYNKLFAEQPDLLKEMEELPLKVFSGKESPASGTKAVFFCYRIPRPDMTLIENETGQPRWSDNAGYTVWACWDIEKEKLINDHSEIADLIRSEPDTKRHVIIERNKLSEFRKKTEKQLINEHLKPLQAPIGVSPILKCWMEIN